MPSSTVNICVLTLVLLSFQQISDCRPQSRGKISLVKDYFTPDSLVNPSQKFEKGDDGQYHLKKSSQRSDSEVEYISAENTEGESNVLQNEAKSADIKSASESVGELEVGEAKSKSLKEEISEKVVMQVVPNSPIVKEVKVIMDDQTSPKTETVVEEEIKEVELNKEKAPFTPIDPKFVVPRKPDSKDEIPLKTEIPPVDMEEKVDEKITIGQVPILYPRVVPVPGTFRIPVIIPVRQVSYGAVQVVPLNPADVSDRLPMPLGEEDAFVSDRLPYPPMDVSDRLPLPYEDDIIGEGAHESESEIVSEPIAEEKRDDLHHHLGNPLIMGLHLPFRTLLKDLKETDKLNSENQAKVVDVLGKKFLMQSNVMKYPTSDHSHLTLRFLSVKPLEATKPTVPKEIEAEKTLKETLEAAERKSMKELELKKEESMAKEKEIAKTEERVIESENKKAEESLKEAENVKAEETQIKIKIDEAVPKEVVRYNMGKPELKIEDASLLKSESSEEVVDEMKMLKKIPSISGNEELLNSEEKVTSLEKTESRVVETKVDFAVKEESAAKEDQEYKKKVEEEDRIVSEEVGEKKMAIADALLKKENAREDMEIASKQDTFLVEKKKKFVEESEKEMKHKKKTEKKKKKKCKCEEKDSDDDDSDE